MQLYFKIKTPRIIAWTAGIEVTSTKIAIFHYYGTTDPNVDTVIDNNIFLSSHAGFIQKKSPPTKINLRDLISRNVPPIGAHMRWLFANIAADHINQILLREQHSINDSLSDQHDYLQPMQLCPLVPPNLKGKLSFNLTHTHELNDTDEMILLDNTTSEMTAGSYRPTDCHPRHKVAIIIPYRDRKRHLLVLLSHLHPILQRQQIDYTVYVVEQQGNLTFNKARIMNIAFITALQKDPTIDCFIFHDVDLIPEDDRNMYTCPEWPRHMSPAIDEMNYQVPYEELVGGVFAIRTEHFFKVNGYSNLYWGWGAEDDDMAYRIQHVGLKITRPPSSLARYKMMRHTKRPAVDGRIRYRLLWTGVRRYRIDGLNSLPSLKYKICYIKELPLYTHIMIDIGPPPPGF